MSHGVHAVQHEVEHRIHHDDHNDRANGKNLNKKVALLISVLALFLAFSETLGKSAQTAALNSQIEASNLWSFFQAKNIRRTSLLIATERSKLDLIGVADPDQKTAIQKQIDAWSGTAARYRSEPEAAGGKGEGAVELSRRGAEVTGMDFAPAMLEIAREKAPGLAFEEGDALALRYPDAAFDAVSVGFGARNFADLDRGLSEMARVTKPGGRVVVLEITTPQKPPLSWFFRVWFDTVVPALGRVAADPDAYTYLPSSVRRFPNPQDLAARMAAAGLDDVRWVLTAGGIIAIHAGTRP